MMNVIMRQMEKMAGMELSITAVGTVGQKGTAEKKVFVGFAWDS